MNGKLLIDGKLVSSSTGRRFDDVNPYTEQVMGTAADASLDDLDAALGAARRAFDTTEWRRDGEFRARCLRQLKAACERSVERLREVLVAEAGCPIKMTADLQLEATTRELDYWASLAESFAFRTELPPVPGPSGSSKRLILKEAAGVVAAITAYNYPFQQFMLKAGPILAAGNSLVLKPSPLTPLTGALVAELAAEETDIPPGVLNILTTSDDEVAKALVADPRVDCVGFTGSTAVGRAIIASSAPTVKNLVLELGGKSAHLVLDDADVASAVRANVLRVSRHAGQGCSNLTRLLLPRSRYEEGLEVAAGAAAEVPWGDPNDPTTHMGPVISERQRTSIMERVRRGLDEGGRLVAGGGAPRTDTGYFVDVTVVADVDPNSSLAQEEVFGPVLAVIPYDTDDDAVAIANNSIFGLAAAVTTPDLHRAQRVAEQLRTAIVDVNDAKYYAVDTPRGGIKQSGINDEYGLPGLEAYLETRVIAVPG